MGTQIDMQNEKIGIYDVQIKRYKYDWDEKFNYNILVTQNGKAVAEYRFDAKSKEEMMERLNKALKDEKRFVFKMPFTREQLKIGYSGKPGCMCGCNGKYYYKDIKKHEDWQVGIPNQKLHDRQLNRIYNEMKKREAEGIDYYPSHEGKIYSVDAGDNRRYVGYLNDD